MKTTKFKLLLMAIPLILMACGQQNRNKDTKKDNYATTNDSINRSVVADDDMNDQDRDANFVKEAASGSLMEVELGRYAQQNAQHARVKNFGAMMVRDHSQVNDELKRIASGKNLQVPTTIEDKHREMMSDIQKKTGADFDREYMNEMIDDHEKDVDKFKKYAENGKDPELKSFASKTLPTLLMHQDSAKNISAALDRNKENLSNK